jgi:hypothetical protein
MDRNKSMAKHSIVKGHQNMNEFHGKLGGIQAGGAYAMEKVGHFV